MMRRVRVKCPVCGSINEGLDLEETQGWVECSCCKMTFLAPAYTDRLVKDLAIIDTLPSYTTKTIK